MIVTQCQHAIKPLEISIFHILQAAAHTVDDCVHTEYDTDLLRHIEAVNHEQMLN